MQVSGTTAIVTGGASGLGAATAARLAAGGSKVFAVDKQTQIDNAPEIDGVKYVAADVTSRQAVGEALGEAAETGPLRIAVNCAGTGRSMRVLGRDGAHDLEVYAQVVKTNLVGTFNVLSLAAELMSKSQADMSGARGVIVNTSSIAAYEGQIGQVAYASSKAGVIGMTLPAARELARFGIRVCTIAPGIVDTPMLASIDDEIRAGIAAAIPFPQRLCTPDEFAKLVMVIVDHDYLNGETIRMDGALRMAPR